VDRLRVLVGLVVRDRELGTQTLALGLGQRHPLHLPLVGAAHRLIKAAAVLLLDLLDLALGRTREVGGDLRMLATPARLSGLAGASRPLNPKRCVYQLLYIQFAVLFLAS